MSSYVHVCSVHLANYVASKLIAHRLFSCFVYSISNGKKIDEKTSPVMFSLDSVASGSRCALHCISQQKRWAWTSNLIPRFSGDTKQKRTLNHTVFLSSDRIQCEFTWESKQISLMICFSGVFSARALKSFVRISLDKKRRFGFQCLTHTHTHIQKMMKTTRSTALCTGQCLPKQYKKHENKKKLAEKTWIQANRA